MEVMERTIIHHGRNVRIARITKGLNQDTLADMIGTQQSEVSRLESQQEISDKILEKIGLALNYPLEILKTQKTEDATKSYNNSNSTFSTSSAENSHDYVNQYQGNEITYSYIPEMVKDIKDLYERLVIEAEEKGRLKERNERLKKENDELKKK